MNDIDVKPDIVVEEFDLTYIIKNALTSRDGVLHRSLDHDQTWYYEVVVPKGHTLHDPKVVLTIVRNGAPGVRNGISPSEMISLTLEHNPDAVIDDRRYKTLPT